MTRFLGIQNADAQYENLPPEPLSTGSGNVYLVYNVTSTQGPDGNDHTFLKMDLVVNASQTLEKRKFVTYVINISKVGAPENKRILAEVFHSEPGSLIVDFVHSPPPVIVAGTREQLLNSYRADPSGYVMVKGVTFEKDTTYHVNIMILTVDNIRNLFASGKEPVADFVFSGGMSPSVGEVRVVPEFPAAAFVLVAPLAAIIVLLRKRVGRTNKATDNCWAT